MNRIVLAAIFLSFLAVSVCAHAGSGSGDSPAGLIDTLGPEIMSLSVDPAVAAPGETITITFTVSEPLARNPFVWVNSNAAGFVSEVGGVYTYTYTVRPSDPGGPATVRIELADVVGNAGSVSVDDLLTLDTPGLPLRALPVFLVLLAVGVFTLRRRPRHMPKVSAMLLVGALLLTGAAVAQDPTVSNVTFVQQPVDTGGTEVVITYDLDSPLESCYVTVSLSKDAGADGFSFPATSVSGDLDEVPTGTGYSIVWDVAADYPGEYLPQAQIRVTATTGDRDYSAWEAPFPGWIYAYEASCQNNLKQMGLVCKMFANESPGEAYPPLSPESGKLMCVKDTVYPEYLTDPDILLCPGRVDEEPSPYFDDKHYVYLGYLVTCDEDVTAFAGAYAAEIAAGGDFSADLPATTSYGSVIYRMREGIDRFTTFTQSDIPIMFDWPDNHQQGYGANVLFMDGHVEWRLCPGEFPMTETTITTLAGLAGYVPPTEWREPDPGLPYALYYSPYIETVDPHGFVADCNRYHLDELAIAFKMFANESPGETWPPLSTEPDRLMFKEDAIYPEYLTNPGRTLCPGAAPTTPAPYFDDRDYVYFGYALANDDDVIAFASAYAAELAGGGDFSGDLPVTTSYGDTMYRLREGIGRFLPGDPDPLGQQQIPVMMEWPDNHEGLTGGHVLYMDGHEEWHPYPGEFPMSSATVNTLSTLAGRVPKTDWAEPCPAYTLENDPYGLAAECREQCLRFWAATRSYLYANGWNVLPMLSNEPGRLMVSEEEVYCEHLREPGVLVCPGPDEVEPEPHFDDQHYVYLGYLVTCDEDVTAFSAAYAAEMAGSRDFSGDLPGTVSYGDTIYRLRDDVDRLLITDIDNPANGYVGPHDIPVLIEWPDNHEGLTGGHVLYMDGHVEWHDYPGEFPMTVTTIATLDAMAAWPGTTEWATRDFTQHNDPYKQALCAYNLWCLSITTKAFANHAKRENYPALSSTPGKLMFSAEDVFPYFLHDVTRLNCPGSGLAFHPAAIDDQSYVYLGYVVLNETDLQAYATAYAAEIAAGGDFSDDLPVTTSYGDTLYRLREGIERLLPTDINNGICVGEHEIPLLIEWPDNHGPIRGGNVVYMDTHTEWLPYPGEFPMTEAAMTTLASLAQRPPIE